MTGMSRGDLRAVIMDVDGTLYCQARLRWAILFRLFRANAARPRNLFTTARILHAFRRAQEQLRSGEPKVNMPAEQLCLACQKARVGSEAVRECVQRWMESEPLSILPSLVHSGLLVFLDAARAQGLRLGVFSDYQAETKLKAMGLRRYFDVVASAQDPEIDALKPSPRGLTTVAQRLGVSPDQAVYVGDRPEVDAVAAASAGMACFILRPPKSLQAQAWRGFSDYRELAELIGSPPR